jgi:hypothetical protein
MDRSVAIRRTRQRMPSPMLLRVCCRPASRRRKDWSRKSRLDCERSKRAPEFYRAEQRPSRRTKQRRSARHRQSSLGRGGARHSPRRWSRDWFRQAIPEPARGSSATPRQPRYQWRRRPRRGIVYQLRRDDPRARRLPPLSHPARRTAVRRGSENYSEPRSRCLSRLETRSHSPTVIVRPSKRLAVSHLGGSVGRHAPARWPRWKKRLPETRRAAVAASVAHEAARIGLGSLLPSRDADTTICHSRTRSVAGIIAIFRSPRDDRYVRASDGHGSAFIQHLFHYRSTANCRA